MRSLKSKTLFFHIKTLTSMNNKYPLFLLVTYSTYASQWDCSAQVSRDHKQYRRAVINWVLTRVQNIHAIKTTDIVWVSLRNVYHCIANSESGRVCCLAKQFTTPSKTGAFLHPSIWSPAQVSQSSTAVREAECGEKAQDSLDIEDDT